MGGSLNNSSPFTCGYHQTWKKLITRSEAVVEIFPGGREAFSVVTSSLFKKAAIKSWDWPMKTLETEEGRGWQDNQTKGRRLLLLPGYNPGRLSSIQILCKDWEAGGRQRTRQHLKQGYFGRGRELHSLIILSISPTQSGEKFFPGVGDGYVP